MHSPAWESFVARRVMMAVAVLAYRVSLDISYHAVLEPYFSYLGFVIDPDKGRIIESYLLTGAVALFVPDFVRRPSDFLVALFAFIPVIPMLSIYGNQGGSAAYLYMAILAYAIVAAPRVTPIIKMPYWTRGRELSIAISILMSFVVLGWFFVAGGFEFFNLDITKVYELRGESHSRLFVGPFGYLNQWVFRVFNILLLAWALYKKNYILFTLFLALQVVYFGVSTEKKVLFAPFLVVSIYLLSKLHYSTYLVVLGLTSVVVICTAIAVIWDYTFLYSLFVRRIMFVPAYLNFAYYEFFSTTEFVKLSNGPLSWLFEYRFEDIPPRMVNHYLRGNTLGWANTGLLGSSFMHFGYAGMTCYAILTRLLLHITDSLVIDRIPLWIGLSILAVPYFNLFTGADLTAALGTHGLGIGLIVLWMYARRPRQVEGRCNPAFA